MVSAPEAGSSRFHYEPLDSKVTAQFEVYAYLRSKILSGELPVGTRIVPNEVAQTLGVSRMPVREALRQLDSEGLVDLRPNRGALVMKLSAPQLFELFVVRMTLEGTAARLAASNRTADSIRELDMLLHRLDGSRHETRLWLQHHNDFHDFVCSMSRMPRLIAETRRFRALTDPYLLTYYLEVHASPELPGHEHGSVASAIKEGTPGEAEEVIRRHILSAAESIVAHYGGAPTMGHIFE